MSNKDQKHIMWSALSIALVYGFINLSSYILLVVKIETNFNIYSIFIIMNVVILPTLFFFLELSGHREKIWKFWKNLPIFVHKIVCIFCLFWIGYVSWKSLVPAIKKDYERNN